MKGFDPEGVADAAILMITPDGKHRTDYAEPKEHRTLMGQLAAMMNPEPDLSHGSFLHLRGKLGI